MKLFAKHGTELTGFQLQEVLFVWVQSSWCKAVELGLFVQRVTKAFVITSGLSMNDNRVASGI